MDLREVGYDDREWINLAQDRDQWRAYVRAAMNLRVPQKPLYSAQKLETVITSKFQQAKALFGEAGATKEKKNFPVNSDIFPDHLFSPAAPTDRPLTNAVPTDGPKGATQKSSSTTRNAKEHMIEPSPLTAPAAEASQTRPSAHVTQQEISPIPSGTRSVLLNLSTSTKCYFENDERDSKRTRMTRRDSKDKERIPNLSAEQSDGIKVFQIPTMTLLMLHRCRTGAISLQRW
ncbi:hypothetical protein ANN_25034 [Periplaneta americana]|uniref:Uncharacterized protein n=1 Tax=Periplaneta americana TaxID=6978 RepID=A0ABQ8S0G4_PERAM|nr:hypothetical protein ANN_25034 [Periplaneta americana]